MASNDQHTPDSIGGLPARRRPLGHPAEGSGKPHGSGGQEGDGVSHTHRVATARQQHDELRQSPGNLGAESPHAGQPTRAQSEWVNATRGVPIHDTRVTRRVNTVAQLAATRTLDQPSDQPDLSNPAWRTKHLNSRGGLKLEMTSKFVATLKKNGYRDSTENMLHRFILYGLISEASKWEAYLELHDAFYPLYEKMQHTKKEWVPDRPALRKEYMAKKRQWRDKLPGLFQEHPMWMKKQYECLKVLKTKYERCLQEQKTRDHQKSAEEELVIVKGKLVIEALKNGHWEHLCHELHGNGAAWTGVVFGVPKSDENSQVMYTEAQARDEYRDLVQFAFQQFGSKWKQTELSKPGNKHSQQPLRCMKTDRYGHLRLAKLLALRGLMSDTNAYAKQFSDIYNDESKRTKDADGELHAILETLDKPEHGHLSSWLLQLQINEYFRADYRKGKLAKDYGHEHTEKMSFFEPLYDLLFTLDANNADYEKRDWPVELRYRLHSTFGHHWITAAPSHIATGPHSKHHVATGYNPGPAGSAGQSSKAVGHDAHGTGKGKGSVAQG